MNQTEHQNAAELLRRTKRRHIFISTALLGFAALVVIILIRGMASDPNKVPSALLGKAAKGFTVSWLQGQELVDNPSNELRLSQFQGKPMILNFWASWCGSCRDEAAYFEAFWRRHRNDGIAMVGIAIQDTPEDAMRFAKAFGKSYILGLDTDGKASIDYGVYGVPETFFIDRHGIIKHKEAGPVTEAMLQKHLADIL